jgi:hypothetical protein
MGLVVEFWPDHYMALYHEHGQLRAGLQCARAKIPGRFLEPHQRDDGWRSGAQQVVRRFRASRVMAATACLVCGRPEPLGMTACPACGEPRGSRGSAHLRLPRGPIETGNGERAPRRAHRSAIAEQAVESARWAPRAGAGAAASAPRPWHGSRMTAYGHGDLVRPAWAAIPIDPCPFAAGASRAPGWTQGIRPARAHTAVRGAGGVGRPARGIARPVYPDASEREVPPRGAGAGAARTGPRDHG